MTHYRNYGFEALILVAVCLPTASCTKNQPQTITAENVAVATSQPRPDADVGRVSIMDGSDLDGSSAMPGAGLRLHNETNPEEDICGIFIEAPGSPPSEENRLRDGLRLQPGATIGIPLTPGTWNVRMNSCTKGKLASAQVPLEEGKVKTITVEGLTAP